MRLIDADALIPMMKYATTDSDIGVFPIKIGFDAIVKVINAQPTIEPEQKKGKWIATQEWGGRNYSCSCCRFSFMVDTCMYEPMWIFCPNCGAEMKGEGK